MTRRAAMLAAALVSVLAIVLSPERANALCTDPPGPGVNWQRCNFDGLKFSGVDLTDARLRDASFFRVELSGSNLTKVDATRAKFVNADMRQAVFDAAKLFETDFTKADLTGASFTGADLRRARLFRSILRGANFAGARLGGADLTRADLSGATWTDGIRVCAEGSVGRCN
jgi:uncharacterized protein YjbI with pentapeptide repeats